MLERRSYVIGGALLVASLLWSILQGGPQEAPGGSGVSSDREATEGFDPSPSGVSTQPVAHLPARAGASPHIPAEGVDVDWTLEDRLDVENARDERVWKARQQRIVANIASLERSASDAELDGREAYAAALRHRADSMQPLLRR